jgi:hypothetical protein
MRNIKSLNDFINESTSIKIGDTVEKKFASDENDYTRKFKVLDVDKSGKAELAEIGNNVKGKVTKMYVSDLVRLNEREVNEGSFFRLPKDIIGDELYLTTKNLQNFYDRTAAGNDVDPGVIDTVIRNLEKVKKAVKKFNSKEDVVGSVYEGEVLLYDELGSTIDDLRSKISNLMKSTTNKKWVTALGSAYTALSNLDRNLNQADSKLGVITLKESDVNEAYLDENDGYWTLYIANKDTTIGKIQVPKGTVIGSAGGGNWMSTDGKIKTHIGGLLDTPDFDKVQNPTWPMTVGFTKEVENWARETRDLIQRDPSKAQAVVNNRIRVINDMKKLLK